MFMMPSCTVHIVNDVHDDARLAKKKNKKKTSGVRKSWRSRGVASHTYKEAPGMGIGRPGYMTLS